MALIISLLFPLILLTATYLFPSLAQKEEIYLRNFLSEKGIEAFLQKPIFGQGINHFIHFLEGSRPRFLSRSFYQPVHNIFWLILAESGLVGLFFSFWLTLKTIKEINPVIFLNANPPAGGEQVKKILWGQLPATSYQLLIFISILLLAATDHYLLTLQQNRLLLGLFLGLVWRKTKWKRKQDFALLKGISVG